MTRSYRVEQVAAKWVVYYGLNEVYGRYDDETRARDTAKALNENAAD